MIPKASGVRECARDPVPPQQRVAAGRLVLAALLAVVSGWVTPLAAMGPPNIVVVLADDVGPGDLGVYHRERTGRPPVVPTPTLDALAAAGMRFDEAHSPASLCAPSRFGLLTGTYSYRMPRPYGTWPPWTETGVDPGFTTLARVARHAGYATAFFGKWGIGGQFAPRAEGVPKTASLLERFDLGRRIEGPNQLGFDAALELPAGIQGEPLAYYENGAWLPLAADSAMRVIGPAQSGYGSRGTAPDNKVALVGDSHWQPERVGPTLAAAAAAFIREQAGNRPARPFLIFYSTQAVHVPHVPAEALDGARIAGQAPDPHGDMLLELDAQIGMLIRALQGAGVDQNTLFIFTSDNGGLKDSVYPKAAALGHDATNGLRGAKGRIWEGGHRVPLLVVWPGVVAEGARSSALVSGVDLMATLASVMGQDIPRDAVLDSVDLLPLLTGKPEARGHGVLVHYTNKGLAALRQGNWKLVVRTGPLSKFAGAAAPRIEEGLQPLHLFDLEDNPFEHPDRDLIDDPAHVQRVQAMKRTLAHSLAGPTFHLEGTEDARPEGLR